MKHFMDLDGVLTILTLPFLPAAVFAQSPAAPVEKRELIYCADRMSPEEREAYRAQMRAARSPEEKAALRPADHLQQGSKPRA